MIRVMDTFGPLKTARETLLAEIAGFISEHQISESKFGIDAVKDGNFVSRLRSGRNMTTGLMERAHAHIRNERSRLSSAA
jgi:hypothetical protein